MRNLGVQEQEIAKFTETAKAVRTYKQKRAELREQYGSDTEAIERAIKAFEKESGVINLATIRARELSVAHQAAAAKAKVAGSSMSEMGGAAGKAGGLVAGLGTALGGGLVLALGAAVTGIGAFTGAAVAGFALVSAKATEARQLMNDASRLNINTNDLQSFEYAANTVGLSGEKVRDIFKDVNEKIGDFVSTGGGEAADVFKKLNLNARDFIGLAPDQALARISTAMQGLSTQDKTNLLESLANDASFLLPLLDNNNEKLKELRQTAIDQGTILSPTELQQLNDFKSNLTEIQAIIGSFGDHLTAYMAGPLGVLVEKAKELVENFGGMDKFAMQVAEWLTTGLGNAVSLGGEVYSTFMGWKATLLDVRAFVYSVYDGLLKVAKLATYTNPASAIFGGGMRDYLDGLIKQNESVIGEVAVDKAEIEAKIATAQSAVKAFTTNVVAR
ncbi:hypothetical protein [Snodgrassella sp. CFCC 13594]|uniref:hypothetical protein n=1 Tax=Snodgrassella sp. CFCC 13594 TaxID=1775559 RepID=UPI00082DBB09|nr:hypothetical protein [Snodgrassella sp. CFCC 13594]